MMLVKFRSLLLVILLSGTCYSFPCPDEKAIEPCYCTVVDESELHLVCPTNSTRDQLANVFQQDFPVKNFYEFYLHHNDLIETLDFSLNGVTFERIWFYPGPFAINEISPEFFLDSADTLTYWSLPQSQLTENGFPFETLSSYTVLDYIDLSQAPISEIPPIVSPKLRYIDLYQIQVSTIEPGTI